LWASGEGSVPPWSYTYIKTDTITVYEPPIADFKITPLIVMLPNESIHCSNYSKNADKYLWEFGTEDITDNSSEFEPLFFYQNEGEYYVTLTVTTKEGCADKFVSNEPVTVLKPGFIIFATAFKPNLEEEIDNCIDYTDTEMEDQVFKPVFLGIDNYKLEIYNKLGEIIFESTDINCGWNGYFDHKLSAQDTYFYKYEGTYLNKILFKGKGSVLLIR